MIERSKAVEMVIATVKQALAEAGVEAGEVTEATTLVGKGAVLDSMGVVSLIVDVEQKLETDFNVTVTLANDRAMSEKNSPFRTVAVLVDHILQMTEGAH